MYAQVVRYGRHLALQVNHVVVAREGDFCRDESLWEFIDDKQAAAWGEPKNCWQAATLEEAARRINTPNP